MQERRRRFSTEKQLLSAALKELEKRVGRNSVLKRPASVLSSVTRCSGPLLFKPTRRVRNKSPPALLAILQAPDSLQAKSRQEIVSRACAWQGNPQPGTPPLLFQYILIIPTLAFLYIVIMIFMCFYPLMFLFVVPFETCT